MENRNKELVKRPIPGPDERPDLYDYYDGTDRPEGYKTGIEIPAHIQKALDERKAELQQADKTAD